MKRDRWNLERWLGLACLLWALLIVRAVLDMVVR